MARVFTRMKARLAQPEVGAGLLFVALAATILWIWLTEFLARGPEGFLALLDGPQGLFLAWTAISFVLGVFLAFLLLRRRLTRRTLWRILLVTAAHAFGALRFYDLGLVLLSVLPLFAIAPRLLLFGPDDPPHDRT